MLLLIKCDKKTNWLHMYVFIETLFVILATLTKPIGIALLVATILTILINRIPRRSAWSVA